MMLRLIELCKTVSCCPNFNSNTMLSKITEIHRKENPSPLFMAKSPEGNEFCPHLKTVLTYPLGTGKTVTQAHNTFQYP